MYPPKPSNNPLEWMNAMWQSLQRASDCFGGEAVARPEDDELVLDVRLTGALTKEMKEAASTYMKKYARACGWRVNVAFKKGYVRLSAASRPASSASRNA